MKDVCDARGFLGVLVSVAMQPAKRGGQRRLSVTFYPDLHLVLGDYAPRSASGGWFPLSLSVTGFLDESSGHLANFQIRDFPDVLSYGEGLLGLLLGAETTALLKTLAEDARELPVLSQDEERAALLQGEPPRSVSREIDVSPPDRQLISRWARARRTQTAAQAGAVVRLQPELRREGIKPPVASISYDGKQVRITFPGGRGSRPHHLGEGLSVAFDARTGHLRSATVDRPLARSNPGRAAVVEDLVGVTLWRECRRLARSGRGGDVRVVVPEEEYEVLAGVIWPSMPLGRAPRPDRGAGPLRSVHVSTASARLVRTFPVVAELPQAAGPRARATGANFQIPTQLAEAAGVSPRGFVSVSNPSRVEVSFELRGSGRPRLQVMLAHPGFGRAALVRRGNEAVARIQIPKPVQSEAISRLVLHVELPGSET